MPRTRTRRRPDETFYSLPMVTEDSYKVVGSWGTLEACRLPEDEANKIADELNALPLES